MKFIISKQDFINLLNKIQNVVPQKPAVPILSNFMIEAANDELILTATDLTVGIRCYTPAKILEEGATTLPAKRMTQLLRELTAVNIEVTTNQNHVTEIVADASRFKINGMAKDEFPSLPDFSEALQFKIKAGEFKEIVFRTAFAISREDNRYVLTGMLMRISNGLATFVGTDGKRLARMRMPITIDHAISGDYIIPLKAVEEIAKILTDNDEEASILLMPDKIAIQASQTLLITKLLPGEYPDIERVIPQQSDTHIALHRDELMTLLRQVSLFITDVSHSVRFSLTQGDLKITANSMEIGEGKVSMPVNYDGPKLDIAFNPSFFLDILRHSREESITLGLTDPYNPGVITEKGPILEANPLFVLMPMRLNEEV